MADYYDLANRGSGGYSDGSGYHDSSGRVVATAEEIQKNEDAARAKAKAAETRIKTMSAPKIQNNIQANVFNPPDIQSYAGTSSAKYGHVASDGRVIDTPDEIASAVR